jgi:hypothetical protein
MKSTDFGVLKPAMRSRVKLMISDDVAFLPGYSDEAIQSLLGRLWIASRSLSSGAHPRDPLARNDEQGITPARRGPFHSAP